MRRLVIGLIRLYQATLSTDHSRRPRGAVCRFYPTCSDYAIEAIAHRGVIGGAWLTVRRLVRCHPWQAGGFDPVPPPPPHP